MPVGGASDAPATKKAAIGGACWSAKHIEPVQQAFEDRRASKTLPSGACNACQHATTSAESRMNTGIPAMALVRQFSNPAGPLKTLLDNTRWYAKDATELIPPPGQTEPIGAQHPQAGWVVEAVERVLAAHDGPMQAKVVHTAVEELLSRSVSWSSIRNALADNASGPSSRFLRVAKGRYRLREP